MIGEMSSLERYLSEGGYRICAITARSIPRRRCVAELNVQLLAACREDERRVIAGRSAAVGALMIEEQAHLLPLAEQGFELAEIAFPRVDGLGCVRGAGAAR